MAGFAELAAQLEASRRLLGTRWQRTTQVWRDGVAQEFETRVISPLDGQAQRAERRLAQLAEIVSQARRQIQ
jgi:hypothetical protein